MTKNPLFSNKGFYLGIVIFSLGIVLMITRVVLEIKSESTISKKTVSKNEKAEIAIEANIAKLQEALDKKNENFVVSNISKFSKKINFQKLYIYPHNPTTNKAGRIKIVEFIDFNCQECIADATAANQLVSNNSEVSITTKINNMNKNKDVKVINLAALIASKYSKFDTFKKNVLKNNPIILEDIIYNLELSGIDLRTFRNDLTQESDNILQNSLKDIMQAQELKLKGYAMFINGVKFSNSDDSEYKLSDITLYLNNFKK